MIEAEEMPRCRFRYDAAEIASRRRHFCIYLQEFHGCDRAEKYAPREDEIDVSSPCAADEEMAGHAFAFTRDAFAEAPRFMLPPPIITPPPMLHFIARRLLCFHCCPLMRFLMLFFVIDYFFDYFQISR